MTKNQVAKPRDAASLILFCRRSNDLEILLGRRPSTSSFMPDVYVFPGGGVERQDADIALDGTLDNRIVSRIAVGGSERRANQLLVAAIRETFEETGLMIAALPDSSHSGGSHGTSKSPGKTTLPAFSEQAVVPDAGLFHYVGRAITPRPQPKRFHARFFACDTDAVSGFDQQTLKGNGELLDLRWIRTSDVGDLPMRSITRFMIEELVRLELHDEAERQSNSKPNHKPIWIGSAVYTHRAGKLLIRHDHGTTDNNSPDSSVTF